MEEIKNEKGAIMSYSQFKVSGQVTQLCEEVLRLTSKAPKKFRFSLCQRMDSLALSCLSDIYRANSLSLSNESSQIQRQSFQSNALVTLKILGTMGRIGTENQCFTIGEYGVLSKKITACEQLIRRWIESDNQRVH